ncbi:hypothetical protein ACFVRU_07535 [Streptomyces sp. NPDC057927]
MVMPLRAGGLRSGRSLPWDGHGIVVLPKNTGGIRSKLKRLVNRGILAETEPGLFVQPRP